MGLIPARIFVELRAFLVPRDRQTQSYGGLPLAALPFVPVGAHNFKGNQLFIIFPVSSFDHAYEGMIALEDTLLRDIGPLFGIDEKNLKVENASTTAQLLQKQIVMKDVIIKNKDARAAFNTEGAIVFLYSFRDRQTLILTQNEETFKVLLNRTGNGTFR